MKTFRSLLMLFVLLALLSAVTGCGNKGDLVRPGSTPQSQSG